MEEHPGLQHCDHDYRRITGRICLYSGVLLLFVAIGCADSSEKITDDAVASVQTAPPLQKFENAGTKIRLTEITPDCGLSFLARTGQEDGRFTILESLGTGVAIVDLDRDQMLDVITVGGGTFDRNGIPQGRPHGIFRQRATLRFDDMSSNSGLCNDAAYSHGVSIGDWDNDGFEDVLITGFQSIRLFRNNGDGTFEDVSSAVSFPNNAWSTSSAFLDADGDGDLEFYIVNYVNWTPDNNPECQVNGHRDVCPPGSFDAISDLLYNNNGDGSFQRISETSGLNEGGKGLAVISGDVDLDGDSDLYVANDTNANFLYINNGHGEFTDNALVAGCALGPTMDAEGSMGVEFADFNKDRLPDIWVSNYENQSFAMYESRAPGVFQHVSAIRGITAVGRLFVGFGTGAFDADLDGDQDRDGRTDLAIAHSNEPFSILHNTSSTDSGWVAVELIGRTGNRSAIGVHAVVNDSVRLVTGGGSYLSDSSNQLIWAVPSGTKTSTIEVIWPSGVRQVQDISTNTVNILRERVEQKIPTR